MKSLSKILLFSCIATFANAEPTVACGSGLFPVVVQVIDKKTYQPISNISIQLLDAEKYKQKEKDPALLEHVITKKLGEPVLTDSQGVALIFHPSGFTIEYHTDKILYSRSLDGTIVLEHNKKEIHRINLEEWAKQNAFKPDEVSIPLIVVNFDHTTE